MVGLALLLTLLPWRMVLAQGPTATPDGPAIALHDAEMLFPAGVRLGLILTTPPEALERATLTLSQPGSLTVTVRVDVGRLAVPFGDNLSRVDYAWPIDPALTFAPFSPVSYRWTVTTADGEALRARGEFVFHDAIRSLGNGAVWRGIEGPIPLVTHNPDLALDVVQQAIQQAYERATAETGLDQTFRFVIYDPGVTFCQRDAAGLYVDSPTIGGVRLPCDPRAAAEIYARAGYTAVQRADFSLEGLQDQLVRRMVASLYGPLWTESEDKPPAWFREGLFQLYGRTALGWTLPIVRDAVRNGGLLPLDAMQRPPDDAPESARLWRAQAYLMTLYLAARFGAGAPFTLARGPFDGDRQSFDAALQARHGVTAARLFADWRAWALSDEAAAAVRWTPYLPDTATPAPTATATATRTPTPAQPSATPSLTPTITPFPASSNTPIPPRPTNTPRPPGSALRPTAAAAPQSAPGGGVCGAPALVV
ncbi:MAG: hypothetical protein IT323_06490, partial [Anaerolineae bacterium]|nr:hypothetical protein [Anaerolineae bacterium]